MSLLKIYSENSPDSAIYFSEFNDIENQLKSIGVLFERWTAQKDLSDLSDDEVLEAYSDSIERLKHQYGFQSADVIKLDSTHPAKDALRKTFLNEHTHEDFEVRFFVEGCGLFYLHVEDKVYNILCEKGDLISVPANVKHWFDMGEYPNLTCIRLFTNLSGWVANFTDNDIAKHFPTLN